mgnify:CR=1 FL=1
MSLFLFTYFFWARRRAYASLPYASTYQIKSVVTSHSSSQLVWNIVKNHSAFLRKQKQGCKVTTFSTDKLNVTNVYSCVICVELSHLAPSAWEFARSVPLA